MPRIAPGGSSSASPTVIPIKKNRLSEEQLKEMQIEINSKYIKTVWSERFKCELHPMDVKQWLIDKGGLNQYGAVILVRGKVIMYEQLNADLEQYNQWLGKKEFADKKRLQDLEEMSKQLGSDLDIGNYEHSENS